ncbi:MAG: T9SS type A sorting domain-containing protein, partial [Schleiferiaceae bacterium]|nr:T9SS type A sorting domain-containing protein [Schleiferiaceae bacterium]
RLLPTRQEPSHGGIAKLDSNLNVVWQYHMPTYRTDPRLTNHALQLYTIPQDPDHFYAVQSFSDTCEAWPHSHCYNYSQLFSRRFFKFDWDGQLVSFREDSIKRKAYTIKAATTDEAGNLYYTGFYSGPNIFRGFIQKFNIELDSIWYVEPTAGFPPENLDLPRNHSRMYVLERIKLINDKLLTGGYMHVPDIPSPQQFAYLTIIDTNGTYQDGTPIGYWSWLSAEAVTKEWTFQVYPQPASSWLAVEISQEAEATHVELYDLTGRKLLQQRLEPFLDRHELLLDGLNSGTYLLHVHSDAGLIGVQKVVIQR